MELLHINRENLKNYVAQSAGNVVTAAYSGKSFLNGQELLQLTSSEQVNLFVIKNLFDQWKQERTRLQSPYFNYEAPEVKKALDNLMLQLSNNIKVSKEILLPLLSSSITQSVVLALNPYEYFRDDLGRYAPLTLAEVKEKEKYFRLNKSFYQGILQQFIGKGLTVVERSAVEAACREVFSGDISREDLLKNYHVIGLKDLPPVQQLVDIPFFEAINLNTSPEPSTSYQEPVQPVKTEQPKYEPKPEEVKPPLEVKEEVKPIYHEPVKAEVPKPEPVKTEPLPKAEPVVRPEETVKQEEKPVVQDVQPKVEHAKEEPPQPQVVPPVTQAPKVTVQDKEKTEASLHERIKSEGLSLAERLKMAKIEDIKSSISLSEKFMFINELFNGEAVDYNQALHEINESASLQEALSLVRSKYASRYHWDEEREEVREFFEKVERKFRP